MYFCRTSGVGAVGRAACGDHSHLCWHNPGSGQTATLYKRAHSKWIKSYPISKTTLCSCTWVISIPFLLPRNLPDCNALDGIHHVRPKMVGAAHPVESAQQPQTITDKQVGDRVAQELRWKLYGKVERDPFLELREAVVANTGCGQGTTVMNTASAKGHHANPAAFAAFQRTSLRSEWVIPHPLSGKGSRIIWELFVYQAWSYLGDTGTLSNCCLIVLHVN